MKLPFAASVAFLMGTVVTYGLSVPDFDVNPAVVHSVTATPSEITFIVSGQCGFGLMEENSEESGLQGSRHKALLDHAKIIIPRELSMTMKSWQIWCQRAQILQGKTAAFQCATKRLIIENRKLVEVRCIDGSFVERK